MHLVAFIAEIAVENGGQERMREPNRAVIAHDHLCRNGSVESLGRNACSFEQRRRGRAKRRRKRKCATGVGGEPADPLPEGSSSVSGIGSGSSGPTSSSRSRATCNA